MSKDKKKEKKHGFIRVSKNLWFMLKYSFKYTPSYTFVTLGEALGRGAWHIIGVLFTKYLFDAIEAGVEFKTVLFWVLLFAGYSGQKLFNNHGIARKYRSDFCGQGCVDNGICGIGGNG